MKRERPAPACCYCGRNARFSAYGIHLLSDLEDPQVPLCTSCGEDDAITCEMIWAHNAAVLAAREATK